MSWWSTVVNTVTEVAKTVQEAARNTIPDLTVSSGTIDISSLSGTVCSAGQFQSPIYARTSRTDIAGVIARSVQHNEGDDNGEGTSQATASARITTRARITYELDRFPKNAMLMFVQIQNNLNEGRNEHLTNQDVSELVETFTSFRFEVDIHTDLTCSQVEQKSREFFQRDFRQYGAVVVIVLSFEGTDGQLSALDGRFSESIILQHLTDDINMTLLAKPKIYITEANRTGGRYSVPLEDHHQDVLGLHIPYVYIERNGNLRPILQLCHYMREMANSNDYVTIVKKAVEETTKTISVFRNLPIELTNNLSKDMILARS